jgi:phosphate transport system protein
MAKRQQTRAGSASGSTLPFEFTSRQGAVHDLLKPFIPSRTERPRPTTRAHGPERMALPMRQQFAEELKGVTDQLVEMTRLVGSAMQRATTALLDADLVLAESVIAADEKIDELNAALEEQALSTMARQAPVATDLRLLVAGLRMSADLERMGDLARHVAKVARMRYPESAVPPEVRSTIVEMGQVAERLVTKTGTIVASHDVAAAVELETEDDVMDRLHRGLFATLLDDDWPYGIEPAIDLTLIGRYYERYADHAVSVARRVVFLVTGEHPTHEDAATAGNGAATPA